MRYLSPFSLPDSPSTHPLDKKALMFQRRKLLAELELNADGLLYIKNRPFSKSDILDYFETLQDESVLLYHGEVGKDKILVAFLEEGQLPEGAVFAQADLYDDIQFLQWISPYFYIAFTGYVKECLQKIDERGLQTLLQNRLLLTDYDRERAWIQIGQLLENNVSLLDHYHERGAQSAAGLSISGISPFVTEPYIGMILMLPKDPFAGVRDRYAFALMQVSIHIFNKLKGSRDMAQEWIENARLLAVSEAVAAGVDDKIREMRKFRKKSNARNIRFAVVLGIIVFKLLANQNWGSSNNTPSFTRFDYINGKDTITIHDIKQLDSVLHKRQSPDSIQTLQLH
ncbi:MAG TPA: hypothetical protein VHD83_20340 [Puia sp.]|nr:hypothetical protein [Puia sp.]